MAKRKCKFTDKMKAKRPCFRKGSFHTIIRAFSLQKLVKVTNINPSGIVPYQIW